MLQQRRTCGCGIWRLDRPMDHLARNADGDELLFVHEGAGELFCDYGHLEYRDGDYIVLPRGTMWRIAPTAPATALLIEATDDSFRLPEKGLVGRHAIFDPAMLDMPAIDDAFQAQQGERPGRVVVKRARPARRPSTYPFNPLDAVGWQGDLCAGAPQLARHPAADEPSRSICRRRRTRPSSPAASSSAPSCRGRSRAIPARSSCRSSTTTTITTR